MRFVFILPLMLVLAACAGENEAAPIQGVNRTIDVTRNADGSYKAKAPECPKWNDETLDRYTNDPMPQLGCASAGNLAKMIADPADLVRSEAKANKPTAGDGERLSNATRTYRGNKVTTMSTVSTSSASPAP